MGRFPNDGKSLDCKLNHNYKKIKHSQKCQLTVLHSTIIGTSFSGHLSIKDTNIQPQIGKFYSF
jgi:hypothetical protein